MQYRWTTNTYHSQNSTGRFRDADEDQLSHGQTGEAWSSKTYRSWDSPGKRPRPRQRLWTVKNDVKGWPRAEVKVRRSTTECGFATSVFSRASLCHVYCCRGELCERGREEQGHKYIRDAE